MIARAPLTLKDRLSRLHYAQACRLLGPTGKELLRAGGMSEIELASDVDLGERRLRLRVGVTRVSIELDGARPDQLRILCESCDDVCEHAGAAVAFVLEEKTALGLAAPPREDTPSEHLTETQLTERALAERAERAKKERMSIDACDPRVLWSDYLVTSAESGKTYRVALRGWARGESHCSCPDYRVNTLGICKHILKVHGHARRRFSEATCRKPYRQDALAVHVRYGEAAELRLLVPADVERPALRKLAPFVDRPIEDVQALVACVRELEALGDSITIYPDAEALIERELHQQRLATLVGAIRQNPAAHPLRRTLLEVELLPYQLDGIAFAAGAGRAVLADDMGLGKTIQAIGLAELLAREAGIRKVLIVCPATLKAQWRSEIERFSKRDVQLVLGTATERAGQYDNTCFFTVCNYEQAMRDILSIEKVKWDLVVLDEGQRIKNWEAKTSRVIKGLRSTFALVLSGTPLENRLEELHSVMDFVDGGRLGPAFKFLHRHRVVDEHGKVLGYRNLDELRGRLAPVLLRRTRQQVLAELPPRSTEVVRIVPTAEQVELHDAQLLIVRSITNKRYLSEMDLLRLQKALLLCRLAANSTFLVDKQKPGWSSKLEHLDGMLGELSEDKAQKIVLFSEWTKMLDLIEPLFEKHGLPFVRLDGSVPQRERQKLVRQFTSNGSTRVFASSNAGATGLNLQAANTVINVDLPWNPAVLEQRVSRAHRMGQRRPVQVFLLVTTETLEERLLGTLAAKNELALAALDSSSSVSEVSLASGIEELKRRLEVLLGAKPPAPIDRTQKADCEAESARFDRRRKLAAAGGQLLGSAFAFLGELAQSGSGGAPDARTLAAVKANFAECLEPEPGGGVRLSFAFPDAGAVERMAEAMAHFLSVTSKSPGELTGTPARSLRR